jgi:hypothetical protein
MSVKGNNSVKVISIINKNIHQGQQIWKTPQLLTKMSINGTNPVKHISIINQIIHQASPLLKVSQLSQTSIKDTVIYILKDTEKILINCRHQKSTPFTIMSF